MNKVLKLIVLYMLAVMPMCVVSCSGGEEEEIPKTPIINPVNPDSDDTDDSKEPDSEIKAYTDANAYANFFAYNVMNDVYLWKQDITSSLNTWGTQINNAINKGNEFPEAIAKVDAVRYKKNGKYIDRWSGLTNNWDEFIGSVDGVVSTTYGCEYNLFLRYENSNLVVAFVIYVYPDSPAAKAGLKRGDMILTVDGVDLNTDNYMTLYNSSSMEIGLGKIDKDFVLTGEKITMTAVHMYQNPVFLSKVFDCGGKKVGYLVYHSFTLDSCEDLIRVCKEFKQEGVTELILDLRYNGGGYVITENLLTSMLAPEANVKAKDVFQTEVWNDEYMEYYKQSGEDLNTYFQTEYNFIDNNDKKHSYSTADANIGLTKIYALVASGSASASESVLVGLLPYMDIEIIGEQTHGKYTTGWMLSAPEWYKSVLDNYAELSKKYPNEYGTFDEEFPWFSKWDTYSKNWGIYIMISRYADKNGDTPCMPDGFVPDIEARDYYNQPYPLGDERENLLRIALERAGKTDLAPISRSSISDIPLMTEKRRISTHPFEGKRIIIGDLNYKTLKPLSFKK